MQRILDLGCGTGESWRSLGSEVEQWRIIGLDTQWERLREARQKYGERGWHYLGGRGEHIPLANGTVDGVICRGALPYMHIPRTLDELHRVLVPGGWVRISLHAPSFAWRELRESFPKPTPSLYRIFVMLNGLLFHATGRVMSWGGIAESCQTEGGMRIAMRRAGFRDVTFRHPGERFIVEARREGAAVPEESTAAV